MYSSSLCSSYLNRLRRKIDIIHINASAINSIAKLAALLVGKISSFAYLITNPDMAAAKGRGNPSASRTTPKNVPSLPSGTRSAGKATTTVVKKIVPKPPSNPTKKAKLELGKNAKRPRKMKNMVFRIAAIMPVRVLPILMANHPLGMAPRNEATTSPIKITANILNESVNISPI